MVKSSGKSSFLKKLGTKGKTAFKKHRGTPVEHDQGGNLPAGIENGIAELVECKFDVYKKGDFKDEYYFMAAGIVKSPNKHEGKKVQGLRTQIGPEPICNTPTRTRKTTEEHLGWVLNELKKLGVDVSSIEFEDLEEVVAELKKEKPTFGFRTWKGKKQTTGKYKNQEPRTNHVWTGEVEYDESDEDDEIEEDLEEEEIDEDELKKELEEEESGDDEEDDDGDEEEDSLKELAVKADAEDADAAAELVKRAKKAGIAESDIEEADSWDSVASMIEGASDTEEDEDDEEEEEEEEGDEDEDEEDIVPEKGDTFLFKAPKARKATKHTVTLVSTKNKTVNLRDVAKKVIRKAVPWDKLISE